VGEAPGGTQEASRREQDELSARSGGIELAAVESVLHDRFDAPDVEELEVDGSVAGGFHPRSAVLVDEAQELLALAQLRPREGPGEELLHEAARVLALAAGLAEEQFWIAHGVGRELLGVVEVVGGASALGDALVRLHALALDVDADELRVAAHPDRLADVTGRHGVEPLLELDVVVGVDLAARPRGRIEPLAHERLECGLLRRLEDREGTLAGRAVHTLARDLDAPAHRLALHVVATEPRLAAEEVLPQVLDLALDVGLGVSRQLHAMGRIEHESSG